MTLSLAARVCGVFVDRFPHREKKGCGAQIEITVNGKPVASGVTVISEECDVEEYLRAARAALTVVGDRPTILQLVRKVNG